MLLERGLARQIEAGDGKTPVRLVVPSSDRMLDALALGLAQTFSPGTLSKAEPALS